MGGRGLVSPCRRSDPEARLLIPRLFLFRGFFLPKKKVDRLRRGGRVFAPALVCRVIGANMRRKLPVALRLEIPHHFIKRLARGRARRVEDPRTFGATETPKTLPFDPYQLPSHCAPHRRARERTREGVYMRPIGMVCRASYIRWEISGTLRVSDFGGWFEVAGTALKFD